MTVFSHFKSTTAVKSMHVYAEPRVLSDKDFSLPSPNRYFSFPSRSGGRLMVRIYTFPLTTLEFKIQIDLLRFYAF
jgi:hypothetical protein